MLDADGQTQNLFNKATGFGVFNLPHRQATTNILKLIV